MNAKSDKQEGADLIVLSAEDISEEVLASMPPDLLVWLDSKKAKKAVNKTLARAGFQSEYAKSGRYSDWRKGEERFRVYHVMDGPERYKLAFERLE
ncbi:MAG: hypothetical protein R3300_00420 [Candidatus Promineifilaceae bacterium]|nr:hypothetical protein [Candidatus Promineifilaceae bacterium]